MPSPSVSWNKVAAMTATNTTSTTSEYRPTSDAIRHPQTKSVIDMMKEGRRKYESPQSHDLRPKIGERDQPTPPMMKSLFGEEMPLAFTSPNGFNPGLTRTRTHF